ncbi:MFS transporter [Alphaproteobacteria bacterium GH1-50]|uniref:MFS transporter n=1 Tax=Kangsaoukella pontilimi TaxID=2691042 RepID=A0A7C9IGX7_9RHOB|nr:MFS transporter [Kangsaoukella pontilimi]MXQ07222.1 MFS transporter [Kangsaoukella pontilimi]
MSATQHDSAYAWTRLAISLAIAVAGNIGMWAVVVVLPDMQADFGTGRADATWPYILAMLGFALGNVVFGRAVDRFGIVPVLVAAGLASGLGFAAAALSEAWIVVTLMHLVLGLGASATFGPLIADVSQWFRRRRGIAVALAASGNYLSGVVWPPAIIWVMSVSDWRGAYLMLAIAILATVIPGAFLLRPRIDSATDALATADAAANAQATGLSPRALTVLLAIAGIGCCVAMSMPQVHIVALCVDRGFGAEAGAGMLSLMLAGGVVSRLVSGALADRFGGLVTLLIGSTLQMLALCLFLIDGGLTPLYLIALIFGLSQGGIVPAYAIIIREYLPPREAGGRVGIVLSVTILGMALGGWIGGWLYDLSGSYALAIWNGVAWNMLNIGIVLAILARRGPRPLVPA